MSDTVHSILNRPEPGARSTIDGDFPWDENIIVHLPQGTRVLSANRYGSSAWTVTVRISVELVDGTPKQYFLKCATEDAGQAMMEGEFWAMTELYKTMPNLVPKPLAWGKFRRESPETYFFLCEFADMSSQVPDPERLCTRVAELHRISTSPTGKFGFHTRTCNGRTPQATEWDSSWTAFFTKFMSHVMRLDFKLNGAWKELEEVEEKVVSHVIPRLIGALEVGGRSVKPCLIHGDLWEGNTGTSYDTGEIYLFDAGSYYGHNEMEIGDWRCPYNKINAKVYTQTYLKKFGMSEPTEEWDDRNRLYSVYYDIIYSCNHTSQGTGVRQMCVNPP